MINDIECLCKVYKKTGESQRQRQTDGERGRGGERDCVCVWGGGGVKGERGRGVDGERKGGRGVKGEGVG